MEEIFESNVRSEGDLAGVFEFDGETSYFYLYETEANEGEKIRDAIRISTGNPDYVAADIAIQWDTEQRNVGLLVKGKLCAVFNCENGKKFGGNFGSGTSPAIPAKIGAGFSKV